MTAGKAQLSKVDLAEQVPAQAQEEQQPMQRASGVANSGVANSARACVLGVEAGNTET